MARHSIHEQPLSFPILIGDIGGTNARFSLLVDAYAEPREFPIVHTADFPTIDAAIQAGVMDKTALQPRSAILAVAGPIRGDEIPLTNCDWVVKPKDMIRALGLEDVVIINDFEAQALAIANMPDQFREPLGNRPDTMIASRVVLGPGTGLGVAGLVHAEERWIPVPGEGGHIDLGPRSERDYQVFPHIKTIEGRIAGEQILCGRGMVNLYNAICAADGIEAKPYEPKHVSQYGLDGSDPQAVETLSLFSTYLGRLAGDMAMIFMARGGVYLAGGISQKILPALKQPEFRAAFEDKAPHTGLMKTIPTYVVTHPLAALAGLATYARTPTRFGLALDGRRWRG
ncbi:glucokinase [Martelella endophytica]|uniref:Glucokinase n=1 Tax=Martelella endophytica TaxID=1486262 RepID=A0A0D5LNA7_MAREN|nr:glucokinase [Martelella endophytica]AJY44798.1 glucokinase [Martelella endophytica]